MAHTHCEGRNKDVSTCQVVVRRKVLDESMLAHQDTFSRTGMVVLKQVSKLGVCDFLCSTFN